jgi:hypothetical protein
MVYAQEVSAGVRIKEKPPTRVGDHNISKESPRS